MPCRLMLPLLIVLLVTGTLRAEEVPAYEPTESYRQTNIEGWPILISAKLEEEPELLQALLREVTYELQRVRRALPRPAVERLQDVPIWLELDNAPVAQFHPDRGWLKANGYNPDKQGAVELSNARRFTRHPPHHLPVTLLHELAHAWHFHVLGFDHPEVKQRFKEVREDGRYEAVLHQNGRRVRHYALTDHKEYFAEMSEAYFAVNDFYPFVRAELREHDREMHDLLERLWGIKP